MNRDKQKDAIELQRKLELRIRDLWIKGATIEELQKAHDDFHSFIISTGVRGKAPEDFVYKNKLSLIDKIFLQKIGKRKSVLEVGVGGGLFLIECIRRGNSVDGIDISSIVVQRLRKVLKRENINASVRTGEASSLAFPDETFDFVISKDVIEHLPVTSLPVHLHEVWRVLKTDGCYLIWTPSKLLGETSLGAHLKEYMLFEIIRELSKTKFKTSILSLPVFLVSGSIRGISNQYLISMILAYEKVLKRLIDSIGITVQNPVIYLIVPPLCIAAYKSNQQSYVQRTR